MSKIRFDVVGIGNAIVDIIGRCDDAFLESNGLPKGHMRLIDADEVRSLYSRMGPAIETSGGSVANTVAGVASFGGRAAFIGRVSDDEFGRIFGHDIRSLGVAFNSRSERAELPTSRSLVLVTPDGERTMNTFLGISPYLDGGFVDADMIAASKILYLEGYLFDRDEAKAAFHHAAELAAAAGTKVALSLSDAFCVERHRSEFLQFVRDKVDILFANETEVLALYEASVFDDAIMAVRRDCALAVVTRSEKGSVILAGERTIEVPVEPVARVVDATGAGDLYAAGFLFGQALGHDLRTCGRLASLAAAEVIGHIGARPAQSLQMLARKAGLPA